MSQSHAMTLRAKKLGILMRDARMSTGKTQPDCAQAMDVTPDQLQAFEMGEASPSLPQLELLSFFLDVPLDHFWSQQTLTGKENGKKDIDPVQLIGIRQRMVSVLIRKARVEAGLSLDQVSERTGLPIQDLQCYESGEAPLPLPSLEALSQVLNRDVKDFIDQNGPVGSREVERRIAQELLEMPTELRVFITKPINRPYIELAQRLSEMSVEKLRAVAEGLLEITL